MIHKILFYLGFGIFVLAVLINVAVGVYESFNPPHDLNLWGLLASAMLFYGLPLAIFLLVLGFFFRR